MKQNQDKSTDKQIRVLVKEYEKHGNIKTTYHSTAHKSRSLQISERVCLTSSLISDNDCNSTSSVDIYFSPIICLQFKQYLFILLQKCKKVESLN